jgi:hypothetical protein
MPMTIRRATCISWTAALLLMAGCAKKTGDDPTGSPTPPADATAGEPAPSTDGERPAMSTAECNDKGGRVVGDIGDGAIHRPDYKCDGGQPPLGSIRPAEGQPVAIEGAVCCPASP